jgi:hypothetical protein
MLLNTVMLYWAILALVIVAACFLGLLTHRGPQTEGEEAPGGEAPGGEAPRPLFDFSGGRDEGRRMQKALGEALAESDTDAEFERRFKLVVRASTGIDTELTWAWLGRSLMEYRRADEFAPSSRALAARFLRDIPRRYHLEEDPAPP